MMTRSRKTFSILRRLGNQRGTSLIELLIASFIGLVVVGAAFELYLTQHKNWIIQDQVTDAQQAARSSMRMLTNHIRMAGYGLPTNVTPMLTSNSDPDTLTIFYQPPGGCQARLQTAMTMPTSELDCSGADVVCFEADQWAYIHDPVADSGEWFIVSHVHEGSSEIEHSTMPFSKAYPVGSLVMKIEAYRFYIDKSDSLHPTLMHQKIGEFPDAHAENIADLQFRYVMQNGDTLDVPNQAELVRQVLIEIAAHTDRTDLQFEGEYRRREFATKVQVRNLGF